MRKHGKELRFSAEGATAEGIERANAAARAVFKAAGADSWAAAVANFKQEGAVELDLYGVIVGFADEECELASLCLTAIHQAVVACYGSEENYYNSQNAFDGELVGDYPAATYHCPPVRQCHE